MRLCVGKAKHECSGDDLHLNAAAISKYWQKRMKSVHNDGGIVPRQVKIGANITKFVKTILISTM